MNSPTISRRPPSGKRFAVMWELNGCPYCRETHLVNFARPDIAEFVQENFDILQLNVLGSRKVTDFDGEELGEKQLAAKYGVKFTPTIQFFPTSVDGIKDMPPAQARGDPHPRLSAAGRFSRRVPLRAASRPTRRQAFGNFSNRPAAKNFFLLRRDVDKVFS